MGNLDTGCHTLTHRNSATLPHSPTAPPISEISRDSVNSCRRMCMRRAPSASRRATSRERSAARAANRLPRLAHAANTINPASSINPVTNACMGRPKKSPPRPGRANTKVIWPSSLGYVLSRMEPIEFRSAIACAGVTPSFRCPITIPTQRFPRSFRPFHHSTCS